MGLKILHSADWHLDSPFTGFSDEQRSFLKQEQKKIPDKLVDLCCREGCQMMLLSGDLFDGDPSRDTVALVKNALRRSGVPVFISPGNHDFCKPDSPWLAEDWPDNVYIFTGGLESVTVSSLDCRIYGAGYRSMDCPGLLDGFEAQGSESYCIALLHADPMQSNSPYCPITAAQVRQSGLDYLALGHIHKAGAFRTGNTLCAWPGCPMGRGWDETGDKGACIVTLADRAEVQAVSLDTIRFHDLEIDIGTDPAQALEAVLPGSRSLDFYRVSLTGFGNPDLEALSAQFSQLPNLYLLDKTEPAIDLWSGAGDDSLEGIYFEMLRSAAENEPERAEQIRLAAEISRLILSGREIVL